MVVVEKRMDVVERKMEVVARKMAVLARKMEVVEAGMLVWLEQQQREWDVGICRQSRELVFRWVDGRWYLSNRRDSNNSARWDHFRTGRTLSQLSHHLEPGLRRLSVHWVCLRGTA
jgi:hypothetical protein